VLKGLLFGIREFFFTIFKSFSSVTKDKETGKPLFLSHQGQKKLYMIILFGTIAGAILFSMFKGGAIRLTSVEKLDAQLRSEEGLNGKGYDSGSVFYKDPSSLISTTPLSDQEILSKLPSSTERAEVGMDDTKPKVSSVDCSELNDKLKTGEALIREDQQKMKECIASNTPASSGEERAIKEALNNGGLTDKEREVLTDYFKPEATKETKNLAKAIAGSKKDNPALYKELSEAISSGDNEKVGALSRKYLGLPQKPGDEQFLSGVPENSDGNSEGEQNLIGDAKDILRRAFGIDGVPKDASVTAEEKEKAMKDLAEDTRKMQEEKKRNEEEAKDYGPKASEASSALAKKQSLSPVQAEALTKYLNATKAASENQAKINENQKVLKEATKRYTESLYSIVEAANVKVESGYSVFEETNGNESVVERIYKNKKVTKSKPSGKPGSAVVGIKVDRKNVIELEKLNEVKNSLINKEVVKNGNTEVKKFVRLQPVDLKKYDAKTLVSLKQNKEDRLSLSGDVRILAKLKSKIIHASNGTAQRVTFKILEDVYHPKTNDLIIPAGSSAFAKTGAFDEENGVMQLKIYEIAVGGGETIEVPLIVGSGDGTEGLKGTVYDTRGKYYAGAMVSTFASGVLSFFSATIVSKYTESQNANDVIIGSGLGGAAAVAKEIAEAFTRDMQGAPMVFFASPELPVILYGGGK
jgi:hypothetical protein